MAKFHRPVEAGFLSRRASLLSEFSSLPYWPTSHVQFARDLLQGSDEPIEYDDEDEDYRDNCFFFPEDCTPVLGGQTTPVTDGSVDISLTNDGSKQSGDDKMTPELPDIKMLDAEVLGELLEDNLSLPEITSLLVFATNGAIFACASSLSSRQLRNLSATYGAAYTLYAKTDATGNLTGVNPASDPSSFVTAPSIPLGNVGSIIFEHDNQVAVVTKIADKVLLAAAGPSKLEAEESSKGANETVIAGALEVTAPDVAPPVDPDTDECDVAANGVSVPSTPYQTLPQPPTVDAGSGSSSQDDPNKNPDSILEAQYEIDRNSDLARLASLNLSSAPHILLALESKSAVLGRFLSQKLSDLECPDDF